MSLTQSVRSMESFPLKLKHTRCADCHTFHDPGLNPEAKEFIPHGPVSVENSWIWNQPAYRRYCEPTAKQWSFYSEGRTVRQKYPLSMPFDTYSTHTIASQSTGQTVAMTNGLSDRNPAKVANKIAALHAVSEPVSGSAAGSDPASPPDLRPSDRLAPRAAEEANQGALPVQVGNQKRLMSPTWLPRAGTTISPTKAAEMDRSTEAGRSATAGDETLCAGPTVPKSACNGSVISKKCSFSPSQCSDSTKPRRPNSCDSRANSPAARVLSATTTAPSVIPCEPLSSVFDLETSEYESEYDVPSAISPGRRRTLSSSSSLSISAESNDESGDESSAESDDESSDESSDEDSTLDDDEWDEATAVAFLPSSSVDSADDFIQFDYEAQSADTPDSAPSTSATPVAPAFVVRPLSRPCALGDPLGRDRPVPCSDQVDSGLSAEFDLSESDAENSDEDEPDEDGCQMCRSEPTGTCATHQRIAEANQQLPHWCCSPPSQPRTSKVRFLSGDQLATVYAAPDYDRSIASDLLDQQRERDRLQRWREDVDHRLAPVLTPVLASEHRQRVLRERPELLRSS